MKNVLLTTTALVAFAGAAAAAEYELGFSGDAEAGYDFTVSGSEYFYWEVDADATLSLTQELNNGAVASLTYGINVAGSDALGGVTITPDTLPVVKLETSYGSISAGAIDNVNVGVIAEVAGMDVDTDGVTTGTDGDTSGTIDFGTATHILRAETTLGGYALAASTNTDGSDIAANVSGSAGDIDFVLAYETNAMGVNVSGEFSGVSFLAAYASDELSNTSMGLGLGYDISSSLSVSASYADSTVTGTQTAVGVAYAAGGITAAADYDVDASILDLEAGYSMEVSAGMTVGVGVTVADATGLATVGYSLDVAYVDGDLGVYAGYEDDGLGATGMYVGANYDLGGGASAFIYSADAASDGGPLEWAGARAGIALTF